MARAQWFDASAYELYVGRWSRVVSKRFVASLGLAPGQTWLDAGCGTGALSEAILALADPARVLGVDKSDGYVSHAGEVVGDPRAKFSVGDVEALELPDGSVDVVACGLTLNFLSSPEGAALEFRRVLRPGGLAAAFVWDYAEGMQMMRAFWDCAVELDPAAAAHDEGRRTPICRPQALRSLWSDAGLEGIEVGSLTIATVFRDFEDYWQPLLGAQGSVPGYLASLTEEHQDRLRDAVAARLPVQSDGSIPLTARVLTVRGRRAGSELLT